jgi:hypothetical protein
VGIKLLIVAKNYKNKFDVAMLIRARALPFY